MNQKKKSSIPNWKGMWYVPRREEMRQQKAMR